MDLFVFQIGHRTACDGESVKQGNLCITRSPKLRKKVLLSKIGRKFENFLQGDVSHTCRERKFCAFFKRTCETFEIFRHGSADLRH